MHSPNACCKAENKISAYCTFLINGLLTGVSPLLICAFVLIFNMIARESRMDCISHVRRCWVKMFKQIMAVIYYITELNILAEVDLTFLIVWLIVSKWEHRSPVKVRTQRSPHRTLSARIHVGSFCTVKSLWELVIILKCANHSVKFKSEDKVIFLKCR